MKAGAVTGIFAGVALLLVLLAVLTAPGSGRTAMLGDEGELFFPGFADPAQATTLEVVSVDEKSVSGKVFTVQQKDGLWTIPTHYDYPADAEEHMAKAAGLVIGLTKGAVRSDSRAEHRVLGVVAPMATGPDFEGRGISVRFLGQNQEELASLIVGKAVEGRDGYRFVRTPDSRRTYMAKVPEMLSTNFADWVETDLLKLETWNIDAMTFDNYSIDEEAGVIRPGDKIEATKDGGVWEVAGLAEGEELEEEPLTGAVETLGELKIVGVRPKPTGLTERLESARGFDRQILLQSLMSRGYFIDRKGKLHSNEGDLHVRTSDGLHYVLQFGEVVYGSVEEVSAGSEDETERERGEGDELRANRYLMVMVDFDEAHLEKPEGEFLPEDVVEKRREATYGLRQLVARVDGYKAGNEKLPETLAELVDTDDPGAEDLAKDPWGNDWVYTKGEDDTFRIICFGQDGVEGGESENADIASDALEAEEARLGAVEKFAGWQKKVEEGGKKAAELQERFAPWFYVIDAGSFDKIHVSRDAVVRKVEKDDGDKDDGDKDDGDKDEGD